MAAGFDCPRGLIGLACMAQLGCQHVRDWTGINGNTGAVLERGEMQGCKGQEAGSHALYHLCHLTFITYIQFGPYVYVLGWSPSPQAECISGPLNFAWIRPHVAMLTLHESRYFSGIWSLVIMECWVAQPMQIRTSMHAHTESESGLSSYTARCGSKLSYVEVRILSCSTRCPHSHGFAAPTIVTRVESSLMSRELYSLGIALPRCHFFSAPNHEEVDAGFLVSCMLARTYERSTTIILNLVSDVHRLVKLDQ
ncbi:hypothetical protein VNO77_03369 [Canavalia gladiata]|uniref:Uncharacterized protein n=1 Tax=Canavalia gladiata TaxID=3824 RepID=A0AAN9MUS2_CANGL